MRDFLTPGYELFWVDFFGDDLGAIFSSGVVVFGVVFFSLDASFSAGVFLLALVFWLSDSHPFFLASEGYSEVNQPDPLKINPDAETKRCTFPLQLDLLHFLRGLEETDCIASKVVLHFSHSYS